MSACRLWQRPDARQQRALAAPRAEYRLHTKSADYKRDYDGSGSRGWLRQDEDHNSQQCKQDANNKVDSTWGGFPFVRRHRPWCS